MPKERHRITPASYIVLIKDGKTLLGLRHNTGYMDGRYGLVSGHAEKGESFTDALIREIKEEINIEINSKDAKVLHVMHRKSTESVLEEDERVDVFFTTNRWQGEIKNTEPDKCAELSWFDMDDLPENTISYVRHAIENIQKGIYYSEYGWQVKRSQEIN